MRGGRREWRACGCSEESDTRSLLNTEPRGKMPKWAGDRCGRPWGPLGEVRTSPCRQRKVLQEERAFGKRQLLGTSSREAWGAPCDSVESPSGDAGAPYSTHPVWCKQRLTESSPKPWEGQRGQGTRPRSHSKDTAELGLRPRHALPTTLPNPHAPQVGGLSCLPFNT